ncbi:MAG: 6-phosphofructokinase [Actinomycetales bacterium]
MDHETTTATTPDPIRIGVLTSGGDAQGMNAAVRAVVRTALHEGAEPYAIYEGWQGAVDGGDRIKKLTGEDVGNILHRGGTVIGTARSKDFRERAGRLRAAKNLLEHGIDRLVVIGGDGSLTGTNLFRSEWSGLLAELVAEGEISAELAEAHPTLRIAGLVGSIDNDLVGADATIGADSALHRIIEAIDALSSTAASHQRSFVVEVMGRHCGYLPLMAAIAGGCDYVLVPEQPPKEGWEDAMCASLRRGREAGRRDSLVIVAEGARDRKGEPITSDYVKEVIESRLGEDTRVTILGHVQRGGTPSAYDRWMSTVLGYHAALEVINAGPDAEAKIIAVKGNRVSKLPLMEAVEKTREVAQLVDSGDYKAAVKARGATFYELLTMFNLISVPPMPDAPKTGDRVAIVHVGGMAPGMNVAVRAAVRLGVASGHTMLGVQGGMPGLIDGNVRELGWGDVDAWIAEGGAELGTRRSIPSLEHYYALGRAMENNEIDALIIIGGFNAYLTGSALVAERERFPAFRIPIVCVPASLDNNLPGSEMAIGADSAMNNVVWALDGIRLSASAAKRWFIAETMGRMCGFLAFSCGLAAGAARVYLNEEGIRLADLASDVSSAINAFDSGRRFFLVIRNERASDFYTTDVLARMAEAEADGRYDVRQATLGHIQQGGAPSPGDRVLATRLMAFAIDEVSKQLAIGSSEGEYVGLVDGNPKASPIKRMMDEIDIVHRRPRKQWWMEMLPVLAAVRDVEEAPVEAIAQAPKRRARR